MNIESNNLTIPEGIFPVKTISFNPKDKLELLNIYNNWVNLSTQLRNIGARGINLPEGLSESAFCIEMDCIRVVGSIPKANSSWDCYNLNTKKRIQVKACSVLPDLTSFGPSSQWDELYFVDFYNEGKWDGTFNIYKIENNLIYSHKVNANQTFRDQQLQKRRPRFSIYKEIILRNDISPIKECNLSY
tara:strand:+ start:167 stop:730 length:564 start_codon:yes stop_codon:yes gene_type:complete